MKNESYIIADFIYKEMEKICVKINKKHSQYINEAIAFFNKLQRSQITAQKLKKESGLVRAGSMQVLKEFEKIDYVD